MQAGTMGRGGEIFILDMGEPIRIVDLARDMIELSGFVPGEDVEIRFSGIRPGEKLFEELAVDDERAARTGHPKIFIGRAREHRWEEVDQWLGRLATGVERADVDALRGALAAMIPEFSASPAAVVPGVVPDARRDRSRAGSDGSAAAVALSA
jgi:FlaA1/EpsC-like NDP-sugar epimerase